MWVFKELLGRRGLGKRGGELTCRGAVLPREERQREAGGGASRGRRKQLIGSKLNLRPKRPTTKRGTATAF